MLRVLVASATVLAVTTVVSAQSASSSRPAPRGLGWLTSRLARAYRDPAADDGPPQPPGHNDVAHSANASDAVGPKDREAMRAGRAEEARIQRQIKTVEGRLRAEEQNLQRQLERYAKMRDAALKKQDSKTLEQISKIEKQLVDRYQQRVSQLLRAMPGQVASPESSQQSASGQTGASQVANQPTPSPRSPSPRRAKSRVQQRSGYYYGNRSVMRRGR